MAAVVLVAGFTHGAVGFGFGMVVMSVLPLVLGLRVAVPVVALLGLVMNVGLFLRYRASVERRRLLPIALGAAVGAPLGVAVLHHVNPSLLAGALGVLLMAYVGWRFRSGVQGTPDTVSTTGGAVAGLLGGTLGAAFNIGAPPVIVYADRSGWPPAAFKGQLQAFFVEVTVLQLALFGATGLLGEGELSLAALLVPVLAVGAWLGVRASERMDRTRFRAAVLVVVFVLGANLATRAVLAPG